MVEYSRHVFCEALPEDVRATVEMMALEFLPETWPVRFVALLSMLEDITSNVEEVHRPYVFNNWVAIVSGLLEHLPRDLASPECLALMRHSVLDRFRQAPFDNRRTWSSRTRSCGVNIRNGRSPKICSAIMKCGPPNNRR
ncbi:hypothetical protein [Agrobacterium fabrum]|uniref:hypothetical protein n=1 Tax=Agrobacterium fabrum TaxID=1176649 RepID=UPI00298EE127|nr:hypothetical protein [Agrobacterium fabrum]